MRQERQDAWTRASIFARSADRLRQILMSVAECPCTEKLACASYVGRALEEEEAQFKKEWAAHTEGADVRE